MARKAPRGNLQRQRPKREPYDRVLIACVGERTEPLYFRELAKAHGLSTANVVVVPSHLDPMGVVKLAKEKTREERRKGDDTTASIACSITMTKGTLGQPPKRLRGPDSVWPDHGPAPSFGSCFTLNTHANRSSVLGEEASATIASRL